MSHWNDARFAKVTEEISARVDAELIRLLTPARPVPNLHDAMMYSLGLDVEDRAVRGKRIRPVLCLVTAEALGVTDERPLAFACAIELLHNFALVHDDIEDGDTVRRGRPATYIRHGVAQGINTGDYMLAKVFAMVGRDFANPQPVRDALAELLHDTLEQLFSGQALDIGARERRPFTRAEYNEVVALKTGSYLAAPMIGGAIVAGAPQGVIASLHAAGHALGPLFQIKDDLIDLTTGKGRGALGNDIREGKRSFLVAVAGECAPAADLDRLYRILDLPREETTEADVEWAIGLFERVGALDAARAECERLMSQARAALAPLPPELREAISFMTDFLARRTA